MTYHHTMPKTKIAVTLEATLLDQVDELVRQRRFPNRSQAIEAAVAEQVVRFRRTRLAEACAKLDPAEERALAEEGFASDAADWPEY
jgi:Arc/MetJ-type ribon-helix-helix transcriptional regulator